MGKRVYNAVDDDASRAEQRLRDWTEGRYGSADLASRVGVWGPTETCVEGPVRIVEAGARFLLIDIVFDQVEQMERIAAEIASVLGAALRR